MQSFFGENDTFMGGQMFRKNMLTFLEECSTFALECKCFVKKQPFSGRLQYFCQRTQNVLQLNTVSPVSYFSHPFISVWMNIRCFCYSVYVLLI